MAIGTDLIYAKLDELNLDPLNPRLDRHQIESETSQDELMAIMSAWVLDELACSYLESGGFWSHEPLIVVKENLYGNDCLVVVEGNRRLSALLHLRNAFDGHPLSAKWARLIDGQEMPDRLFEQIPYVLADTREDVQAFLGFRHVTGIKQWDADEKAAFISQLIDNSRLTYKQVARKIGSNVPTVRKHYIAYKVLLQIENEVEDFEPTSADKRFAVLYMTLDKLGAQEYLHIDSTAMPEDLNEPVPTEYLDKLANVTKWLFGTNKIQHIVTDTRQVSDFGKILESSDALKYLEETQEPKFGIAFKIAGGEEDEILQYIRDASHKVELALTGAHLYKGSIELQKEVRILGAHVLQLLNAFQSIKVKLLEDDSK
ncbi:MAG: hypothetical protein L3J71_04950 [Victivallaceae bacterium]|nr:hypothetical protein [Victivallaceae bacterium]